MECKRSSVSVPCVTKAVHLCWSPVRSVAESGFNAPRREASSGIRVNRGPRTQVTPGGRAVLAATSTSSRISPLLLTFRRRRSASLHLTMSSAAQLAVAADGRLGRCAPSCVRR